MSERGSDFYEDEANFEKYMERRQWQENANDTLEKPVVLDLIGDVGGKSILDLGCGDARFGAELLGPGHLGGSYTGIEGSVNMIQAANETIKGQNAQIEQAYMEDWSYPADTYDLVISRLAIHYIEDLNSLFRKVYHTLKRMVHLYFR